MQVPRIYQHRLLESTTSSHPQFNLPPPRDPDDRPLWHCTAGRGSITTTILGKGCRSISGIRIGSRVCWICTETSLEWNSCESLCFLFFVFSFAAFRLCCKGWLKIDCHKAQGMRLFWNGISAICADALLARQCQCQLGRVVLLVNAVNHAGGMQISQSLSFLISPYLFPQWHWNWNKCARQILNGSYFRARNFFF